MYGEEETEDPASFAIFFAEGEALAKQGAYKKAIECFTKVFCWYYKDMYKMQYMLYFTGARYTK